MTAYHPSFRRLAMVVLSVCALGIAAISQGAIPTLTLTPDPAGLRITWDAQDGFDYVLEESPDFITWTNVNQVVVKEGSLHRALIPVSQVANFYRLVNDGVRTQAAYVGSEACMNCHSTEYGQFIDSGHSYKLNKVDGAAPTYFSGDLENVPNPPDGWTWDDVSWVIGGALWKARFIDNDGYIVTGTNVQFNLATQGWVGYHSDEAVGTKPYNCGSCHTTGWVPVGSGGVNQDGQPGMHGSFAAPGVHCEACHGPASRHVATFGNTAEITKDRSSALCGECHIRGSADTIPASGGFIRHHEQYNEMLSAGHSVLSCNDCHNPHISSKRGLAGAIIQDCTTTGCHDDSRFTEDFHNNFAHCSVCHLPKASKSAVAVNQYQGDVKTHIFKINPNADGEMFNPEGTLANGSTGVTLSYVCYQCHKDESGVGGNQSIKSLDDLADRAQGFHSP